MKPTYLSLFSGIGGLDLGLDRAGWRCVGQVEIDPFCRKVLEKHWPEVPRHDDVRTCVEWWGDRGAVDAVAGGFPCQGHSVAGRRCGTGDERWGWPWFRDVVDALAPRLVIVENVPNLVRTGLLDVLRDLAALGFDAWWGRVPAAAVGAPHLRWRLFLIAAHPGRVDLRHEPGWSGGAGWTGPAVAGHDGATWALADPDGDPGQERRASDAGQGRSEQRPRPDRTARDARRGGVTGDVADPAGVGRGHRGELRAAGDTRWRAEPARRGEALADPNGGGQQPRGGLGRAGQAAERNGWWAAEPDVGRVAHGVPRRVERLRALGNAVVPQVAEHVGRLALSLLRTAAPS